MANKNKTTFTYIALDWRQKSHRLISENLDTLNLKCLKGKILLEVSEEISFFVIWVKKPFRMIHQTLMDT